MNTLEHLRTSTIVVSRMTATSGYKSILATVTADNVHIQPLSPEKTQLIGGVMGKTFKIWTDPTLDIQPGDTLRSGTTYYVVADGGVSRRTFGSMDFNEVIVKEVG